MKDKAHVGEFHTQPLNPNDPKIQTAAMTLAEGLIEREGGGVAFAVGTLIVALEVVLTGVLHMDTPMPEQNVQSVRKLLDALTANVMLHAECCRHINGVTETAVIH